MDGLLRCPRCGVPVGEPSTRTANWTCPRHGVVAPLQPFVLPGAEVVRTVVAVSDEVPVWLPWPLPYGWLVTGVGWAGDERGHARATVVAVSGPNPLGGPADMIIVAEEPSVGLGASYAGLTEVDPGAVVDGSAPHARVEVGRHPAVLWSIDGPPDRAVYVGEAAACWLWVVLHPASAGLLLLERLRLADVRELGGEIEMIPFGALSPRVHLVP